VDGTWPVAGPLPGFRRQDWPIPAFGQLIEIVDVALRFEYLGDDLDAEVAESRVSREAIADLPNRHLRPGRGRHDRYGRGMGG
jgi:hypothetical protein